jgi:hypothetical protein
MELIYRAEPREIVLDLDLRTDLADAGLLLDTYGNLGPLTDEEVEERERENERRVELFEEAYRKSLAEVAAKNNVTVWIGDCTNATRTVLSERRDDTLERWIWQDAHDLTPLPWVEQDDH